MDCDKVIDAFERKGAKRSMTELLTEPTSNLGDATRAAWDHAPCGIAYVQGRGWAAYDLRKGCGDHDPEFVYLQRGKLPFPLTQIAAQALQCALESKLPETVH